MSCNYCRGKTVCGAVNKKYRYTCTRDKYHRGSHIACGSVMCNLFSWPSRPLKSKEAAKTTHNKRIKSTSSMRKKTRTA
jgi:hypothetical protein